MSHLTNQIAEENRGVVELTASDRHSLLAAKRRRVVLDILSEGPSSFTLRELSTAVAAREDDADEGDIEQIAITLHHAHLPKMDEFGVVTYDRRRQQIVQN